MVANKKEGVIWQRIHSYMELGGSIHIVPQ